MVKINKNGSGWYLFKAILALLFSFLLFYAAIPKLVLMFVEYPTLDQATIIEGTLHVKQSPYRHGTRRSPSGTPDPRNFVIDSQGLSHKIFWRIKGDGYGVFHKDYEGLKVKVWFHPWYGVIQGEYEETPEMTARIEKKFPPEKWGKEETMFNHNYDKVGAMKALEYKDQEYQEYNWGLLIFLLAFIYTIFCFRKFFKVRCLEKAERAK